MAPFFGQCAERGSNVKGLRGMFPTLRKRDRKRQLLFFLWDMFFLNMMAETVETWHQPEDEANA